MFMWRKTDKYMLQLIILANKYGEVITRFNTLIQRAIYRVTRVCMYVYIESNICKPSKRATVIKLRLQYDRQRYTSRHSTTISTHTVAPNLSYYRPTNYRVTLTDTELRPVAISQLSARIVERSEEEYPRSHARPRTLPYFFTQVLVLTRWRPSSAGSWKPTYRIDAWFASLDARDVDVRNTLKYIKYFLSKVVTWCYQKSWTIILRCLEEILPAMHFCVEWVAPH